MPKFKKGSPEAKAHMAKIRAARKVKEVKTEEPVEETINQNDDIAQLKAQIEELKKAAFFSQQPTPAPVVSKQVVTKYSFDPKSYPNPVNRLREEEKLKPLAFDYHYEIKFKVERWLSEEDNQKIYQPRFILELWRKLPAEEATETQAAKPERLARQKIGNFFEDPDSYVSIANEMGIDVPEELQQDFLNEMRYISFRNWLFDALWPPKPNNLERMHEEVIGNMLMPTIQVTRDVGEAAPDLFGKLEGR